MYVQERMAKELNKLIDQKHFTKLYQCSNKQFVSPIVLAVKRLFYVMLISIFLGSDDQKQF